MWRKRLIDLFATSNQPATCRRSARSVLHVVILPPIYQTSLQNFYLLHKVPTATYIPTAPPQGMQGCEPEKLAAILARYSRSNEGAASLVEKYADKTPDAIFKFIDYGHASIGGLTGGIAIAIDGVSMLLACKLFEFAQMADGQESSTRYIKLDVSGMPPALDLGIPDHLRAEWRSVCELGFTLYQTCLNLFEAERLRGNIIPRIPDTVADPKVRDRMIQNYSLDRSRYFLPLACKTNIAIVATARIWADVVKLLESLWWNEAVHIAALIREQLKIAAPNLVRHSHADDASTAYVRQLMEQGSSVAAAQNWRTGTAKCDCDVSVMDESPSFMQHPGSASAALATRGSRYHHTGVALKRQVVRASWSAVAVAELRDLNRHRTGYRYTDWSPRGFYLPPETRELLTNDTATDELLTEFRTRSNALITAIARTGMPGLHAYGFFLGTQVPFEHTQAADKFLYEVELRTGMGAHFRYAEHLRQAADLYFKQVPDARGSIRIGSAEQEAV